MTSAFLTVNCVNREASAAFYESVLGATVDPDQDFNLGTYAYRIGTLRIVLLHNAVGPATDEFPRNAMNLLTVEVPDLAAAYQQALRSSGGVIQPPGESPSMLLTDPDGIAIEVFQASRELPQ